MRMSVSQSFEMYLALIIQEYICNTVLDDISVNCVLMLLIFFYPQYSLADRKRKIHTDKMVAELLQNNRDEEEEGILLQTIAK